MKRKRMTLDKESAPDPPGSSGFHTTEQIGLKRHLTPEGFLLCKDVAIARTGWMLYGPNEVPIKPGPDGYVMIYRDAETLFAPSTIMSITGKACTDDHPISGVDSYNWNRVAVGTAHNVRQGTGEDRDVLLADLLITNADAIRAVQQGKREVSLGYDASYEQTGLGQGRQRNIIGNHIALVEKGRCGPRCAIGDHSPILPPKGKPIMAATQVSNTPKRRVAVSPIVSQMILDAAAELEAASGEETETELEESGVHVHIHNGPPAAKTTDAADPEDPTEKRIKAVEDTVTKMGDSLKQIADTLAKFTPGKTGDGDPTAEVEDAEGKGKTGDSAALETSFKAVLADAEVLVPGFALPTFDSKAARKITVDSMCGVRRKALDAYYATSIGKANIDTLRGSSTLDTAGMTCVDVASVFRNAAGAQRLLNNRVAVGDGRMPMPNAGQPEKPKAMTLADIQELNRKQYPL